MDEAVTGIPVGSNLCDISLLRPLIDGSHDLVHICAQSGQCLLRPLIDSFPDHVYVKDTARIATITLPQ